MRWLVATAVVCLVLAPGALAQVGVVDTIGGTTYDWQWNGPSLRSLCASPGHGVHAVWMYSASRSTSFPDRNLRYNFFDYSTQEWNWVEPDFMWSGVGVFTQRAGYGNLAADPVSGVALVPCHVGTPLHLELARDMAPGAGIFEYCDARPNVDWYLWPVIAVTGNGWIHAAIIRDAGERDDLFYTRCTSWCNWSQPIQIPLPQPEPGFPAHNLAASRRSLKVAVTWVYSSEGYSQKPGFYRISTDGGSTWGSPTQLPWPPAYQGDTLPSFHPTSLFPCYDSCDQLHIVASVSPFYRDTNYVAPSEIWHWCPANRPAWSRIHSAQADPRRLHGSLGYNVTFATRPSVGEDAHGGLFVAWEQFDTANVEPRTGCLRADIWVVHDRYNNGQSWREPVRITRPDSSSKRYPCVVDEARGDVFCVEYLVDSCAGAGVVLGPITANPVVCHWVPLDTVGLAESHEQPVLESPRVGLSRGVLTLRGAWSARLLDLAGREVMRLRRGENDVSHVSGGVYFVVAAGEQAADKVVIQH